MGWITENKECKQKRYGGYRNNARSQSAKPLRYKEWERIGCPKKIVFNKEEEE